VLRAPLPPEIRQALATPATPSPTSSPSGTPATSPGPRSEGGATSVEEITAEVRDRDTWPWILSALVLVGVLIVLVRSLRPR
jgi:hypothetical protein